jgi:hypothetical protein
LYTALFDIHESFCPLAADSYQQFLGRSSHRQIQD